jgi:hypothetical protein
LGDTLPATVVAIVVSPPFLHSTMFFCICTMAALLEVQMLLIGHVEKVGPNKLHVLSLNLTMPSTCGMCTALAACMMC